MRIKPLFVVLLALILVVIVGVFIRVNAHPNKQKIATTSASSNSQLVASAPQFDKSKYSTTDPTSIWVIVNKTHPLPSGYAPKNLVKPAVPLNSLKTNNENSVSNLIAPSLEKMVTDAKAQDLNLFLASGYRSEALQTTYFNNYVAKDGLEAANKYSAKPGQSEHQTGFAFDLARTDRDCYLEICFGDTPEGKWLAANVYKYGFIIRYPKDKTAITGYQYEPWHLRYVGPELAAELHKTGQTLEEYFNVN